MEISVAEAARRVGVSCEAVRAQLRDGTLKGRRVGYGRRMLWYVDAADVAAWAARRPRWGAGTQVVSSPAGDAAVPGGGGTVLLPVAPRSGPADSSSWQRRAQQVRLAQLEAENAGLRREVESLRDALASLLTSGY